MKLLLDQDIYRYTATFLLEHGHDVVRASELGLARASDEELLKEAEKLDRLLVTRDRIMAALFSSDH